jgi:hypothetical protein
VRDLWNVRKPPALHATSVEIDERITVEDYDLNPFPLDKTAKITDPALVRTPSGEVIRVLKALDSVAFPVRSALPGSRGQDIDRNARRKSPKTCSLPTAACAVLPKP